MATMVHMNIIQFLQSAFVVLHSINIIRHSIKVLYGHNFLDGCYARIGLINLITTAISLNV